MLKTLTVNYLSLYFVNSICGEVLFNNSALTDQQMLPSLLVRSVVAENIISFIKLILKYNIKNLFENF